MAIVEANIMEGKEANFKKQDEAFSAGFSSQYDAEMSLDPKDTPYDVESVLHYGPLDFSKTGQPVIKFLHEDEGRSPRGSPHHHRQGRDCPHLQRRGRLCCQQHRYGQVRAHKSYGESPVD